MDETDHKHIRWWIAIICIVLSVVVGCRIVWFNWVVDAIKIMGIGKNVCIPVAISLHVWKDFAHCIIWLISKRINLMLKRKD